MIIFRFCSAAAAHSRAWPVKVVTENDQIDGPQKIGAVDAWSGLACNTAQGTNFGTTRLDQVLAKSGAKDLSAVQQVLAAPEVLMECNIYSVIFDFHHNRFWLASGEIPAAKGGYREFQLFK
jgi:hypothetical protein